jgi:hypothetical protein
MLYQPEERRLTHAELHERVEVVRFETILNPINNVCSITHDVFEPTQQVARIRHCGHIFNADSLTHWLRMNNTCPTCRHNLLTSASTPTPTTTPVVSSSESSVPAIATAPIQVAANAANNAANAANNAASSARAQRRIIDIPLESEININSFYNELLQNSRNIPGFELNSVDDNSVVFSFDLMNNRMRTNANANSNANSNANANSNNSANSNPNPHIDDVD